MIRVGFIVRAGVAEWLGGLNYTRNLLTAMSQAGHGVIEPVLIMGEHAEESALKGFPKAEVLHTGLIDRTDPKWVVRQSISLLSTRDLLLDRFLVRHGVQALSHSGDLGRNPRTAVVSWIPDFQHRHLPQFFTRRERLLRDLSFRRLLWVSDSVIVSSHSAERDLRSFSPHPKAKIRVLQFAVKPPAGEAVTSLDALQAKYGFTGQYFHLPNQFWIHKNHRVVVQALDVLRGRGVKPLVLATGAQQDYRRPRFFSELQELISRCGVGDSFRILGVVPYGDLVALMRHSLAVINPSLFEGWSTTVEEAKGLGKPVILSDIPVHREQAPARAAYFDPHSANALADVLAHHWEARTSGEATALDETGAADRYARFAETYEQIIAEAVRQRT